MKRLFFTATYAQPYLSGITDYIQRVTTHLAKKHAVTLQVFQHDPDLPLQEKLNNVTISRLKPNFKLSKGFIRWRYPLDVWAAVSYTDEVFINLPQVESIFVAIAAKLQHKKLTVIYHCELVFETGFVPKLLAFVANFSAGCVCALSDSIIAYTEDYAQHSPVVKPYLKKVIAITPPVEVKPSSEEFSKKLTELTKTGKPIIGFSGRISREKGLTYLVAAVEKLQQNFPRVQLLCAGPFGNAVVGEENYYSELQQKILKKNLPVTFLGRLSKSELNAFYKHIDMLVLPSTNRTEAFGLVQAEALLQGTPVITTDLPGVRTSVQRTEGGLVVPLKNSNAIAEACQEIFETPEKFNHQKIQKKAQAIFSLEKTLNWYDDYTA